MKKDFNNVRAYIANNIIAWATDTERRHEDEGSDERQFCNLYNSCNIPYLGYGQNQNKYVNLCFTTLKKVVYNLYLSRQTTHISGNKNKDCTIS